MTSIEYGGGPTLEQRRQFCNLEEGGHIPGYMGFCPQFKYKCGKSYGKQTAEISKQLPYYDGPKSQHNIHLYPTIGSRKEAAVSSVFKDEVPGRMLPRPTGDNKYIEGMIPGYSGDVPHLNFKFGATYRQLCDDSVDEFVREYKCLEQKREELKEISKLFPNLRPISNDPSVRDKMNIWADELLKKTTTVTPVRGPTEPPIPGYSGFIPRVETTDAGLSRRYHDAAKRGLETFRTECNDHEDRLREPMTGINTNPNLHRPALILPSDQYYSSRIFRREGMIPDYEGHIHGFKFEIGKNFGNTTRDLDVCAHSYPSYGEYVKDKMLIDKYLPPY